MRKCVNKKMRKWDRDGEKKRKSVKNVIEKMRKMTIRNSADGWGENKKARDWDD